MQINKENITLEESIVTLEDVEDSFPHEKFSHKKKSVIVAIISVGCFLSPASGMAFLPSIPEIKKQFHTTLTIIDISNAVYCILMALSPCMISPLGDIYGRRSTLLTCTFLFSISLMLTAISKNLVQFFIFRALSAIFGTPFLSVGAMVISDLFRPEERGTALSWTLATSQIGPALSPVLGGIFTTYANWRVTFWFLFGLSMLQFILVALFLPETGKEIPYYEQRKVKNVRIIFLPYNPFKVIYTLRHMNFIIAGFISILIMYNMYGLLTPIRELMDPRFHLTDPVYGSLFYLAPGSGFITGSLFGGRWADYWVRKYKKNRGYRYPEDRLRSMYFFIGFLFPASMLVYGWSLENKKGGIAVPLIAMYISGVAQTFCFPSVNTYCTDCMPEVKGSGIASNYMLRYIGAAIASASILKQIETIGIGWTCTISSFFIWLSFLLCLVLVKYGDRLRSVSEEIANREE